MKVFTYDGISCDTMGLRYLTTVQPILPTLSRQVQTIPGRPGEYFFGSTIAAKQIQISVSIVRNTLVDVDAQIHAIAAWLLPTDAAKALVLPDEPDKTYYAVLDGDTSLSVLATMGSATLTFVCVEPYAEGEAQTTTLQEISTVQNPGTSDGYPIFDVTLSGPTTFLAVATEERFVLLGQPNAVNETPVSTKQRIIYDEMTDLSVWQTGHVTDYGGVIQGAFATDGSTFYVSSYGTATNGWAGPALVRSVPTPFHDFDLHVLFNWSTNNNKDAMGRIEVYGLDVNGEVLCKMVIGDYWDNYALTETIMRIGAKTASNAVEIMDTYGKKKGDFNSYYGSLEIQRKGQQWTATTARRTDTEGVYTDAITKTWFDKNKEWDNDIAQVEIHIAQYQSHKNPGKCTINHVFLYELSDAGSEQVPNIGDVGDVIRIDCTKAAAYVNGTPRMDLVDPSSDLPGFSLNPGSTSLEMEPWNAIASAQMTLNPRYL